MKLSSTNDMFGIDGRIIQPFQGWEILGAATQRSSFLATLG
jgi:hypothetical protein